jgi:6-phosphogluconolactonase
LEKIIMANDQFVFIGTYTRLGAEGVYTLRMNGETGELTQVSVATGLENPSFVSLDPSGDHLYAVSESSGFDGSGGITAFNVNKSTGELNQINQQSTGGPGPCHLMLDSTDSVAIVTNYAGGSVSVHPINADGSVGEYSEFVQHEGSSINQNRQQEAHAHSVNIDNENSRAYICDLGMDKVLTYDIDIQNGKLSLADSVDEVAGEGPRHFTFHPSGKYVYVNNELGNTITVYDLGSDGSLSPKQTESTIPAGWDGVSHTADIHVSPDGKFVYVSNRGHDSIAMYSIDESTGNVTSLGNEATQGKNPRNFAITPDGKFLLAENQDSDTIVTFKREDDGTLTPTGSILNIPAPVCLQFLPVGG